MSEFGLRFRCACPRDYDDPFFFRMMSNLVFLRKKQLDDWANGILKHPAFRKCRRCKNDYVHQIDIPKTTWMLSIQITAFRIQDIMHLPRFVTTISRPTERPEDDFEVRWRLGYISAIMPIPHDMEADHLVSLQFLHRGGNLSRFYYDSTDGHVHADSPSEKLMTNGQLLKKKCNEVILTSPAPPGKDITRRPQFAVYFRIF